MPAEPFPDIEPIVIAHVRRELADQHAALARFAEQLEEGAVRTLIAECVETVLADPSIDAAATFATGGPDADGLVDSVVGYVADIFVARCRNGRHAV